MNLLGRRLSTRMAVVFSGMLAAVGAFMIVFFPRGMFAQAQRSTEARAMSIVEVMSTAVAPAIEFDDPEHATSILGWLSSTPDARFAVLQRSDGSTFAAWHPERVPAEPIVRAGVRSDSHELVASTHVHSVGGVDGLLHVGFSLDALEHERDRLRRTVAMVAGLVVLTGVLFTLFAVRLIVLPIRRLTATARTIAAGSSTDLPTLTGPDEVAELAAALRAMLERLNADSQQELLRASRHAGMAEVATGVLHNVGNILNSVNVTVELMREGSDGNASIQRVTQLRDILAKLDPASLDAGKLAALVKFTDVLATQLASERALTLDKLAALRGHVDHIKRVVSMQNAYARQTSVVETTRIRALLEEAVEIALPPSRRAAFTVELGGADAQVRFDRHRALQIVVNLIANARDAVAGADAPKRIAVTGAVVDGTLTISVTDFGVGFTAETHKKMFAAGFTTKQEGHGYGLHSSVLAARQLGGELTATSDGLGRGATFSLAIPVQNV